MFFVVQFLKKWEFRFSHQYVAGVVAGLTVLQFFLKLIAGTATQLTPESVVA